MTVTCSFRPTERSSRPVEDKHERASRLMLVGIVVKNQDQLKNVIPSVRVAC